MKKYLIDNQLIFNPEDRSLMRVDDDLSRTVITQISNRLFCLLLESDGSVITRDTILQQVWSRDSTTASRSNLNNYISSLRKQLSALGLEIPLIITEPKVGFRIDAGRVSVMAFPDEGPLENIQEISTRTGNKPQASATIKKHARGCIYSLKEGLLGLVTAVTVAALALLLWKLITALLDSDPFRVMGVQFLYLILPFEV
ncbi:transcriptional regulator [Erwiniaceae bacterium CAU 1747]